VLTFCWRPSRCRPFREQLIFAIVGQGDQPAFGYIGQLRADGDQPAANRRHTCTPAVADGVGHARKLTVDVEEVLRRIAVAIDAGDGVALPSYAKYW
jgi:hypothetical protein